VRKFNIAPELRTPHTFIRCGGILRREEKNVGKAKQVKKKKKTK
jgi:hypothetical protein